MTRLVWDKRNFEYGVDRGVFYPKGAAGYAWTGLVDVNETTIDASQSLLYIDGVGHRNQLLIGSFAASVSAVTYPKAFESFDGYSDHRFGQRRREFDFSYRTMQADGHYKIHLVYNCLATPSDRDNSTINTVVEANLFEWDLTTRSEVIPGAKSSAHLVIDTTQVNPGLIADLEAALYGNAQANPTMPSITTLLAIFEARAILKITDMGNGIWKAEGPDSVVQSLGEGLFRIDWPSVVEVEPNLFRISSL